MKTTDYTRGTLRPTDWDQYYLSKPTDLKDLYPDCFGAVDKLEDERLDRKVRWIARILTVIIAISASMLVLHFLEPLL